MLGRGYVVLGILVSTSLPAAEKPRVEFQRQKGSLVITIGGKPLATYIPGDRNTRRPYFKHLHAPGGIQVSRNHPPREGDRQDHAALHPGLCLAFGDVSGNDYWRNRARVAHEGYAEEPGGGSGRGSFAVRNRYLDKNGRTVCVETCRFTFLVRPAGYLLIWDSRFKSDSADFYFGDQEEMGLAIRVHTPINVSVVELSPVGLDHERGFAFIGDKVGGELAKANLLFKPQAQSGHCLA